MVFNATFSNISVISWWSVLLVGEIGVPRENHRPAASPYNNFFSSPGELLPSLGVRRLSSVNFSHFKLLLRNHLADWNRT